MMFDFILFFWLVFMVLICVAFITLLERKVLGYLQLRKGPLKLGFMGLLQPVADAVKLFTKEMNMLVGFNYLLYFFSPGLALALMLLFWCVYMFYFKSELLFDFLYIFCISSLFVYPLIVSGWASNSKYSLLGAYRGVAQTLSYEVTFVFIVLSLLFFVGSFSLKSLSEMQMILPFFFGLILLGVVWIICVLAEVNRSPFDFAEGESELVSGFNVEYGSGGFALLFMSEYGSILFMSILSWVLFFGGFVSFVGVVLILFFILWVRGTYVRFRYDKLMMLAWKAILPFSLLMFFFLYLVNL